MMLSNPYFSSRARSQSSNLLDQSLMLEGPVHGQDQLIEVDWLRDVVVGAGFHGLDRRLNRAEGRDHDDGRFGVLGTKAAQHFHAGDTRHFQIGDDERRHLLLRQRERLLRVGSRDDLVAGLFELQLHHSPQAFIVIYHQDLASTHRDTS